MKKLINIVVSAALVITSALPAGAQDFMFRYKASYLTDAVPGTEVPDDGDEDGFGVGNDITAFFTGAIGYDFSRKIPVATQDVAEWRVTAGSMQPGLALTADTGVISGVATGKSGAHSATLLGYDVNGTAIARAAIRFTFHNPVGKPQKNVFYGHTGMYMYREIPSTVSVARWESLSDLPGDFRTEGRYLAGTPDKTYDESVAFIGYDYLGNEVAFAFGSLIVQDGPTFNTIADSRNHPTTRFAVGATVQHKLGEIKYRLIALDGKPGSLGFSEKDVELRGYIRTFSTSLRFQIEAVDFDGTKGLSNVFTLSTYDPDVDLADLKKLHGTVGTPYARQLKARDLSGDQDWQIVAGELPDGLSLDPDTGLISGIPAAEETKSGIVITVSTSDGGFATSKPFDFAIHPEQVSVGFAAVDVRVGDAFATAGPTIGSGVLAPYSFALADNAVVDPALVVDQTAAKVSGAVQAAGSYDVPFKLTNGDGREFVFNQPITAYNPLGITYASPVTVYRRVWANSFPTIADQSVIGSPSFEIVQGGLPAGLSLNKDTGAIVGLPGSVATQTGIAVRIKDKNGASATSNTFSIKVEDRPDVVVSPTGADIQRFVPNTVAAATSQNVFDGVTYSLEAGTLPAGIRLDADGQFVGKTEAAEGTYSGIRIRATDGEGYSNVTPVFDVRVVAPTDLQGLADTSSSASWTVGVPFSLALPRPDNAYGVMKYELTGLPSGVQSSDGNLVGTISQTGGFPIAMKMTDEAHRVLEGTFTLSILDPMTATLQGTSVQRSRFSMLRVAARTDITVPRGSQTDIAPEISNGIEPITYAFAGTLPSGMTFSRDRISGTPLLEGQSASGSLTLTDAAGTTVTLPADFSVISRIGIAVGYDFSSPLVKGVIASRGPSVRNAMGSVTYALSAGTLPSGLKLNEKTGFITGTPSVNGRFSDIVVTATDGEGSDFAGSTDPFEIGVTLRGLVGLAVKTNFIVRANDSFLKTISVGNVTKPLTFSSSNSPQGIVLGTVDGSLSGTLALGTYGFGVSVKDDFGRSRATAVTINAVGSLSATAPKTTTFNQYAAVNASPVYENVIGAAVYELVAGTLPVGLALNPSNGAITGTASTKGVWPGIAVKVTDSSGKTAQTATFALTVTDRLPLTVGTLASYPVAANLKYKLTLPVSNAVGTVTWTQTGALPAGLSFDPVKGIISGTATVIGTFSNITVSATDSVGGAASKTISLVVATNGKAIVLNVSSITTKVGYPISMTPTWSNTVGDIHLWADDTISQYGLSVDPLTGVVSGTATELMDVAPNLHITDASDRVTSKPVAIKVIPKLVINAPERIDLAVNVKMTAVQPTVDNVIGTATRTLVGTLPAGVTFSATGFAGTPTQMGVYKVALTAVDGLGDTSTRNIEIVVANNGIPPGIALTPTATGYLYVAANITPSYTNRKTGDVVTISPNSGPLPPGMTLEVNAQGVSYLRKLATTLADVGVYKNVILRVTDVDGLYSETGPMAFVYASNPRLAYPAVTLSQRVDEPVSVSAPVASAGKASAEVRFAFSTDNTGGKLVIDPVTGALSGFVEKTGVNTVTVTEHHGGTTIRAFSYTVSVTALPLTLELAGISAYVGEPLSTAWTPVVLNSRGNGTWVLDNGPAWLSMDPSSGRFSGTPTQTGAFPVTATYSDDFGTETLSLTASVQSGSGGYKFVKVVATGLGRYGYGQINTINLNDENGINALRIATVVSQKQDWSRALDHNDATAASIDIDRGANEVILEFPNPISFTSAYSLGAVGGYSGMASVGENSTIIVYGSDDGVNFTEIGTGKGTFDLSRK
ncbi:hypothetical protein G6L37_06965 [Agrobacterium rubi]|nr:hypothetical protein [Agrobacterium rubi]NTF25106.1 hypothetical protein [Agrobacterium rubi]